MNPKVFFAITVIFATGMLAGFFSARFSSPERTVSEDNSSRQVRQGGEYRFINPLLECEVAEGILDAKKQNFRDDLDQFIQKVKEKRKINEVAVYFRDLNNGPAFGFDEGGEFFPASLLKIPIMMAYYRWAETEPGLLGRKIFFEASRDFGVSINITPREVLDPGKEYTVEELISRMIKFSDNQATYLLVKNLPQEKVIMLFRTIGVEADVIMDGNAKITVKEYASFFRILFNSSYLSREFSEKALALLAATDYHDALPAGVPGGVPVAHKFGEAGTENAEQQLHDCGIVYFPDHPYLACIMTRGRNTDELQDSIPDISRFIYEKIDAQY